MERKTCISTCPTSRRLSAGLRKPLLRVASGRRSTASCMLMRPLGSRAFCSCQFAFCDGASSTNSFTRALYFALTALYSPPRLARAFAHMNTYTHTQGRQQVGPSSPRWGCFQVPACSSCVSAEDITLSRFQDQDSPPWLTNIRGLGGLGLRVYRIWGLGALHAKTCKGHQE